MLVVTLAVTTTVFYLGGWLGPVLPPWAWTLGKSLLVAAVMLFCRALRPPTYAEEHMLQWFLEARHPARPASTSSTSGPCLLVVDG